MKINLLVIGFGAALFFTGCKKILSPDPENLKQLDQIDTDINFAQGFLVNAYRLIPSSYDNSEYATDDAVTNQRTNTLLQIATGSWTATNNPLSVWDRAYGSIQYINEFLTKVDGTTWAADTTDNKAANQLFRLRLKGEAYGLRAIYMYYLLRAHAGFTDDGQLMGVPIVTTLKTADSVLNVPRASFDECVKFIYRDLDSAEASLPMEYGDVTTVSQIPVRFQTITKNTGIYTRVMGLAARQLVNSLIAKSFRARVALLAASPAFQHPSNTATWAKAAEYASAVIDYKGGVSALPANGFTFFINTAEIDGLNNGTNPAEVIWRENIQTNNSDQENQNFPPTLFGQGLMNPSQNLVDAFPMTNGYPINDPTNRGNYQATNPYAGRDPRLARYIIYNGSTAGVSNSVILTGSASGTLDGINVRPTSTRTGYYMKKRLRMDVNRNPASVTGKNRYTPRIRYTEIYLAYAEAANEAFGPTGTGGRAYSAYDVIKRIRNRAGIAAADAYLEEAKADKNKMRELIRNERRLELSFEGFRFWDLRRWKANLNETVKGMDVSAGNKVFDVENRVFQDYMYYGPIPFSEVLKFSNLKQNKGWR